MTAAARIAKDARRRGTFHRLCSRPVGRRTITRRVETPGYAVTVAGLPFFAHKEPNNQNSWRVSSVECGCMLGVMPTRKGAIADAEAQIAKVGLAKTKQTIAKHVRMFKRAKIVTAAEWATIWRDGAARAGR